VAESVRGESTALAQGLRDELAEDAIPEVVATEETALAVREHERVLRVREHRRLDIRETGHQTSG